MSNTIPAPIVNGVASGKLFIVYSGYLPRYMECFVVKKIEPTARQAVNKKKNLMFSLTQDNDISSVILCFIDV